MTILITIIGKFIHTIMLPYTQLFPGEPPVVDPTDIDMMRDPSHFNICDALAMFTFLDPSCIKVCCLLVVYFISWLFVGLRVGCVKRTYIYRALIFALARFAAIGHLFT